MRKGIKWAIVWILVILVVFCASFVLTVKLYIEPAYEYISKDRVESYIADLNQQIADREEQIEELEAELEKYRSGTIEGDDAAIGEDAAQADVQDGALPGADANSTKENQ